jgi:hypothetical protein
MESGALGFQLKDVRASELAVTLRGVMMNERCLNLIWP